MGRRETWITVPHNVAHNVDTRKAEQDFKHFSTMQVVHQYLLFNAGLESGYYRPSQFKHARSNVFTLAFICDRQVRLILV